MPNTPRSRPHEAAVLAAFLLVAFAAGGIGAVGQGAEVGPRYLALQRPSWAPPPWLFGPVWSVLYAAIGVADWRVWRAARSFGAARFALVLWAAQLLVNAVWPAVFFGREAFGAAVAVILVLDALVAATVLAAWRHDRVAGLLLMPYLAWLGFATALNVTIWQAA